jgi:hypothetical protein
MWILKGTFLGLWLFGFGTITFLYFAVHRGLPSRTAVAVDVITSYTTQNPWWWAALAACTVLGFALVRSWPGKESVVLWIFLLVTSVVPVGFFGLFYVLSSKLKAAAGVH